MQLVVLVKVLSNSFIVRPSGHGYIWLDGTKANQSALFLARYLADCDRIYRNEDAANRIISELRAIQPDGQLTFIKKDLTLLKNVDEVCEEIKGKERKLNILFMTQGVLSLKGRDGDSQ